MAEYETWVPTAKDAVYRVPRLLRWMAFAGAFGAFYRYSPQTALESLFYLGLVCIGILVFYMAESWTAARDRAAVAAGVPTGGWGAMSTLERFKTDAKIRKSARQS